VSARTPVIILAVSVPPNMLPVMPCSVRVLAPAS
jgi:hypothetical protein